MIRVTYKENDYLEIKGHANFGVCGKDLICAGVSCIGIGLCNYLYNKGIEDIKVKNGYIRISLENVQLNEYYIEIYSALELAITQLRTIEQKHSMNINVEVI